MAAIVETRDLTRRYGTTLALDHLNLEIPQGAIFGFIGPNGAGKTTTMRILTTLLPPIGRRGLGRRPLGAEGPARRAQDRRLHARFLRRVRRHEGLGVPGFLRPRLWRRAHAPRRDDRRTARIWSTWATSATIL